MTNRLENLKVARTKLDGLQVLSDTFRDARIGDPTRIADLKTKVAKATDDMLVYLRTTFPADEALAAEISTMPRPFTLTEDQQALKDGVRGLYQGGTGELPTFEPEALVETRDGVIIVAAMRYLLSTIKAPLNTQESERFDDFSQTYKGCILAA